MLKQFRPALFITFIAIFIMSSTFATALTGKLRISGDNSWVGFVNGEQVAEGADWQAPTVSEFEMDGYAVIAVYVHDAEPGAAGVGGALADVALDDGRYFGSDETWKADAGSPIEDRNDGWETVNFDDSGWENAHQLDPFGEGVWGFGADTMRGILNNPDCTAYWVWAGPNDGADDVYLRLTIGQVTAVTPQSKLATIWGTLKSK